MIKKLKSVIIDRSYKKTFCKSTPNALLTIYKSFIRPHLGYGDILYDKPNNENFQNKIEKLNIELASQ